MNADDEMGLLFRHSLFCSAMNNNWSHHLPRVRKKMLQFDRRNGFAEMYASVYCFFFGWEEEVWGASEAQRETSAINENESQDYVFNEWIVLQKHIRWMKCLNLYQMSAVLFFILIGVACSMSSLSVAGFGSWLLAVWDAGGCVSMTLWWWMSFVVLAIVSSIIDVSVIDSACMSSQLAASSSKLSVDIVVRSWFDASSSAAISILRPLCLANNFNSSIASRASRFSCKNLFFVVVVVLNAHQHHHRKCSHGKIQYGVILFAFRFPVERW